MVDKDGSPTVTRGGEPKDEEALVTCVDRSGNPVVVPTSIGYSESALHTVDDRVGRSLAVGPWKEIEVGHPEFAISYGYGDSWHCNSFNDGFDRPDGPLGPPWLPSSTAVILDHKAFFGNGVWGANFTEQNVIEKIDTIISQAKRFNFPFLWFVGKWCP